MSWPLWRTTVTNCRYPCIPRCKRWTLAIWSVDPSGGEANALSVPPGKYDGNVKTQRNRRGFTQAVDHVAQFDNKRGTLPGLDRLMKSCRNAGLPTRTLAQVLHGCCQHVSWDAPLNGVTCATLTLCFICHRELPGTTRRKVGMTPNQHGPLMPWAAHMIQWGRQRDAKE